VAKRKPESIQVGGFTWFSQPPLSDPARERWMLHIAAIHVCVSDYGPDDPRGGYFSGWRIVAGAPLKEEFPTRDAAMMAARDTIKNEVLGQMKYASEVAERTRAAMKTCEAAGIELVKKK
jgi:hypothetical protein